MRPGGQPSPGPPVRAWLLHVFLLGILYGLAELAWARWVRPSPVGTPGDSGGDLVAHIALGLTVCGWPALLAAFFARGSRRPLAAVAVLSAAIAPTAALYVDRWADLQRWSFTAFDVGGARHYFWLAVLGGGTAVLLGLAIEAIGRPVAQKASRPALGRIVLAVILIAPAVLFSRLRPEPLPAPASTGEGRPDLLVLTIDTLRQDALGAYGGPVTPGLDAWIASGRRYDGWTPSSWTRPAMASLFSGLAPSGHGADRQRAPADSIDWWPEVLQRAGYRTVAFVSNPHLRRRFGFDRGFDRYDHAEEIEVFEPVARTRWAEFLQRQWVDRRETSRGDVMVRRVLAWARAHGKEGPWVLWVHLVDPHLPYHLRGPNGALHDLEPGAWIEPLRQDMDGARFFDLPGAREGKVVRSEAARRALRALYQREVAFEDHWVARLLEGLRTADPDRPLAWVLTSDHGEEFWDDGGFEHGHCLDRSVLRVPLAMGGLPVFEPGSDGGPLRLEDVGPVLLQALGVDGFSPARHAGLDSTETALMPFAVGRASVPAGEAFPPLLAEGMLYGPPRTLLMWPDGVAVEHIDGEPDFRTPRAARPADPERVDRARALLLELEHWRGRRGDAGRTVELDAELRRRLRALGYLR